MALPDSADQARARRIINRVRSYGVEVREMPGHETRGFLFPGANPSRVVDHHDASSRKSGEWGALGLCLDGTPRGIPGPLCNALVARCLDGKPRIAWVADGYAYHAGLGGPYAELSKDNANPHTYGVEKANDGLGEPYTAAANYATNALFYAMAVESGSTPPGSYPIGHKEWAPGRKSDPLYSMPDRRRQVGAFHPTTTPTPTPAQGDDDFMALFATAADFNKAVYTAVWGSLWSVPPYGPNAEKLSVGAMLVDTVVNARKAAKLAEAMAAQGRALTPEQIAEISDKVTADVAAEIAAGFKVVPADHA